MRKSKWFARLCAFCPGAGQMYLGEMCKGAILLAFFCAIIIMAITLRMEALIFLLPVVWMYSFFDAINGVYLTQEEHRAADQAFVEKLGGITSTRVLEWLHVGSGRFWGWGCILLGGYLLMRTVAYPLLWPLFERIGFLYDLWYNLPTIFLATALVVLGVKLVFGGRPLQDDLIEYRGNEEEPHV